MNWRAIGCGLLAAGVFVGIGVLGMSLAFSRFDGCPPLVRWADRRYQPSGVPTDMPTFEMPGEPVPLGSTFIGLTTRSVFGPPGSRQSTAASDRPDEVALDCGDGLFQTYRVTHVFDPAPSGSP